VIGGIAGWIAGIAMKTKYGLVADVVVGVVGALTSKIHGSLRSPVPATEAVSWY
jgi:uncharacterized membrane protein YeaQ/YmgE (transglycosylase-associated protein family)